MKPYGVKVPISSDVYDIKMTGSKGSVGNLPGKGGDTHSYFRNAARKRSTRRYWKRVERAKAKREIKNGQTKEI